MPEATEGPKVHYSIRYRPGSCFTPSSILGHAYCSEQAPFLPPLPLFDLTQAPRDMLEATVGPKVLFGARRPLVGTVLMARQTRGSVECIPI